MSDLNNLNIKKYLLENMISFHEFCEKHDLKYYLLGGTLLGAVRHQGFIPWDDDFDVAMSRKDYEKLLALTEKTPNGFELNSPEHTQNYIYPFAKFCSKKVIVEEPFYKPFITGIWIDVFPLDYTFDNTLAQKIQFLLINFLKKFLILKTYAFKPSMRSVLTEKLAVFLSHLSQVVPFSLIYKVMYFLQVSLPNRFSNKKHLANFQGAWGIKESAPKTLFENRILLSFEGKEFWAVKDFDFWLTKVYGDYMKLPPEEKRVPEHIGRIVEVKDK
jgi:lipopolysaccharide cholinephosphotransferase